MPILTTIDNIPLFSTPAEALAWSQSNGLGGLHTHTYQGQTGYMGGSSHQDAVATLGGSSTPTATSTSSGSGGSGGY